MGEGGGGVAVEVVAVCEGGKGEEGERVSLGFRGWEGRGEGEEGGRGGGKIE